MNSQAIEDLNALLQIELAANETYKQALSKFKDHHTVEILHRAQQSHLERANKLRSVVVNLKGTAIEDIGIGGKFAKLVIDGADKIGDKAIVIALQADEGEWTANYEWRLVSMHGDYRPMVKDELLPQQKETEGKLSELANAATDGLWPATPGTKDI